MNETTDCGCCSGVAIDTPAVKDNRPGLPSIAYRVGLHSDFKATILARLSSTDYPALAPLKTRSDDDPTIALCDSFAMLADVLTFYQERVANESYLRTATERLSVLQLARLIGYQLAPGVAASTALAFTLESAPGMPSLAAQPVTILVGTRVQSVPDPDQAPQSFETVAAVAARVEWNAIPVQQSESVTIQSNVTEIYIAGTDTQLQPGDAILLVRGEREQDAVSERWDVRWVEHVDVDLARSVTRLAWSNALDNRWLTTPLATQGVRVYAFRQRAALFGHNAPDANLIFNNNNKSLFESVPSVPPPTVPASSPPTDLPVQWKDYVIDKTGKAIDLDTVYPKVVAGSWFALAGEDVQLLRVVAVTQISQTRFGVSGKLTRLESDNTDDLSRFQLQYTQVLAQSEELGFAERPLTDPVFGSTLVLGELQPDLMRGQLIAVSGKRQRVVIGVDTTRVSFSDARKAEPGESFIMAAPPEQLNGPALASQQFDRARTLPGMLVWHLEDRSGAVVKVKTPAGRLSLQSALKDDDVVSEICSILDAPDAVQGDLDRTTLKLQSPLKYCYDRTTIAINANVALATHGETVSEIAGSGDAGRPNQSFQLKQSPLTYVSTSDVSGRTATLQVRVNDLLWREVPTLYGHDHLERIYALRQDDDGKTAVQFGDGSEGARPPSGQNNVRLSYRKGLGVGGNLRAGQLTMLLTRPLGVKAVTNPAASTGGQDPETLSRARTNAPLQVLTLGRAVSIQDYVDFCRTFSGIEKAYGIWIADGRGRGVHLTVAGPGGAEITGDGNTLKSLNGALRRYGDRLLPLLVGSYARARFRLRARIKVADDAEGEKVLAAVTNALRAGYSFDARGFGQPVTIDEVYATIQNVPGVVAADIDSLYRSDTGPSQSEPQERLLAALPAVQDDGSVNTAELLTLDPAPIELGVMV